MEQYAREDHPKITTRLEPYKTVHSKPINTAADLTELNILHSPKPDKTLHSKPSYRGFRSP